MKKMHFIGLILLLNACQPKPAVVTATPAPMPTVVAETPAPPTTAAPATKILQTAAPTETPAAAVKNVKAEAMKIASSAFENGKKIPEKYTCDSGDIGLSPELNISGAPAGAKSLALIVDDPDAPMGLFTHWVLYNIPPTLTNIPEGMILETHVPGIGQQGKNDFGTLGYGGPCPPLGMTHHYIFHLYALDLDLNLAEGLDAGHLKTKMKGHILSEAEWGGMYK